MVFIGKIKVILNRGQRNFCCIDVFVTDTFAFISPMNYDSAQTDLLECISPLSDLLPWILGRINK